MAEIIGTEQADRLVAPDSRADDIIYGLGGDDFIEARGGTDLIIPGLGNDRIEGGDGRDTVLLSGSLANYNFYRNDNEGIITGPEGIDQLLDVEAIRTELEGTLEFDTVAEFSGLAYLASYEDLYQAFGTDEGAAWSHFYHFGAYEGRGITFDQAGYLAANPDLLSDSTFGSLEGDGPSLHYLQYGRAEGRSVEFDGAAYVASYADLINAFAGSGGVGDLDAVGTQHFIQYGFVEGRQADLFNEVTYAANNPDLAAAGLVTEEQLAWHWVEYGFNEGRSGAYDSLIA